MINKWSKYNKVTGALVLIIGFILVLVLIKSIKDNQTPLVDPQVKTEIPMFCRNNLDHCIAQMIMVGFDGSTLEGKEDFINSLRAPHFGFVILYDRNFLDNTTHRNIESPRQLQKLTGELKELSPTLFVAVDQEGGMVTRLTENKGFFVPYSQAYLGNLDNPDVTYNMALWTATELKDMGIDINLAPVVDVNTNPDNPIIGVYGRSFSSDPQQVVRHASEVIRAHQEQGVLTTLKHFPGHGCSSSDSHNGFVDVSNCWDGEVDLVPFQLLSGTAEIIMTAHIFNRYKDDMYPATLSRNTLEILREDIGYEGVIMSDDMQMFAIIKQYSLNDATILAINAGVDVLMFSNNDPQNPYDDTLAQRMHANIRQAVLQGDIPLERIEESYLRIKKLKTRKR